MSRRIAMWIAVTSLTALGGVSATLAAVYLLQAGDMGWTFYTPYSVANSPPPLARVLSVCVSAQRVLLTVAAISSAAYLALAERNLRRLIESRGFEVKVGPQSGDS